MDYKAVAASIVELIGGKENVAYLEHCSTRLRFSLVDSTKAKTEELKLVPGILNVINGKQQYQVVVGNEVVEVYAEVEKLLGNQTLGTAPSKKFEWKDLGSYVLDFIVGVFQPLVPAMAGGGMIKAFVALAVTFGWLQKTDSMYTIFNLIGDAPLYFLPLLVAVTTARKLKANELVAVAIVGALILPNMTKVITEGGTLFGNGIQNIQYTYQVFPAILTVAFYALLHKYLTKYTPKAIRIFFVPMVSMVIAVPVALLILGPIGYNVGTLLSSVILGTYQRIGWLAVGLLAAILPFMVSTGMHKAMIPYATQAISTGKEALYMPASLAHNIAESGATFGVALKSKDPNKRSAALSAAISAFCGITEPALYGVTLLNKKVLASVVIGALVSGLYLGYMMVEAIVLVGPGFPAMAMFLSENLPNNFMHACIGFALAFVVSFIVAFLLYTDQAPVSLEKDTKDSMTEVGHEELTSPANGEIVSLDQVSDEVFSSKVMGEGFAILPSEGKLVAPANGTVDMIYQTKHAIGFKTDLGNEILFHIGIDTVQLKGEFFDVKVEPGQAVDKGQELVSFDLEGIKGAGFDPMIMVIFTNANNRSITLLAENQVTTQTAIAVL